jgi:hypothetical protein
LRQIVQFTATRTDTDARILVLIGGFHTTKQPGYDGFKMAGARLNEAGIPAVSVQIAGGSRGGGGTFLSDAVGRAGADSEEFMLDMRPYDNSPGTVPFGAGNTDYVIHLPQSGRGRVSGWGWQRITDW